MILRRGKAWYLKIKPFGHPIWVRTLAGTKQEAREIERAVLIALRVDDYRSLWPEAREVCLRIYENQGWTAPEDLVKKREEPKRELTLWDAAKIFFDYPTVRNAKAKERYTYALGHIIEAWGKNRPLNSIKVADVRAYQAKRLQTGASPSTVNWEKGTLSKLFQVMLELEHVESNPVRQVKNLSQKSEERQIYLSFSDVEKIAGKCPEWFRPILWTAYYSGMRRGEIVDLTRNRVNLSKRMIYLGPEDTKEGHWKRVPIHRDLVPILEKALQGPSLISGKVFAVRDKQGVREFGKDTLRNPWRRAVTALNREFKAAQRAGNDVKLLEPVPRFHDLRATWRTNARRSGVDPQIAESILGHWFKGKSVNDRYGYISDEELLQATDKMTFDHGETQILIAKSAQQKPPERTSGAQSGAQIVRKTHEERKKARMSLA